jgi:hypothetical protein
MAERLTRADLDERCANVNRRLESTDRRVLLQGRNGYTALDEYDVSGSRAAAVRTIIVGTKREVGDFLFAMMVGINLTQAS